MTALHDLPESLRVAWVTAALDQVAAGHWSVDFAIRELWRAGFSRPSWARVSAAVKAEGQARDILTRRLARPVGALTRSAAA